MISFSVMSLVLFIGAFVGFYCTRWSKNAEHTMEVLDLRIDISREKNLVRSAQAIIGELQEKIDCLEIECQAREMDVVEVKAMFDQQASKIREQKDKLDSIAMLLRSEKVPSIAEGG